jgi:TRAP-type C4-dicarboxylate transport system permease small subunit
MVNLTSTSAVMEIPLAWLYGSGMVLAVLGAPILLSDLWRLLNGQIDEDHLLLMQDSEESPRVGGADRH